MFLTVLVNLTEEKLIYIYLSNNTHSNCKSVKESSDRVDKIATDSNLRARPI